MYFIDYHTHSRLSPDSQAPLDEMAQAAAAAGMSELCITDHYDLLTEDGARRGPFDWASAVSQYDVVAPQYAGRLELKLGLELGSPHINPAYSAELCAHPKADFIIGSLHNWSEESPYHGRDFYYNHYGTEDACYEALDDYFNAMERLAPLHHCYDVLGHIIYPLRYMERDGQTPSLSRYEGQLRRILRTVVEHGRGIEVNTYRGRTVQAWVPILKLYRECGGEILTIGSDAHRPEDVGGGVKEAYQMIADLGFRYITRYHRHQPDCVSL